MANYSKKSISKPVIISAALTVIILISVLGCELIRTYLTSHKNEIEEHLAGYLNQKVSIGSIHYVPPSFIILKDISVSCANSESKYNPIVVKRITLIFSIKEIIRNKNMLISKIYFVRPEFNLFDHPDFFKENVAVIVEAIKFLAKGRPLKIITEDATVVLERNATAMQAVLANAKLKINSDNQIASYGTVDLCVLSNKNNRIQKEKSLFDKPLSYIFLAALDEGDIKINTLKFTKGNFHAAFKGRFRQNLLRLKGASTVENFYRTASSVKRNVFISKIRSLLLYQRIPQKVDVLVGGLNIFDIDCLVRFNQDKIQLENIAFYLNKIPVRLQGSIVWLEKILLDLNIATFPDQPAYLRGNNPKKLDAKIAVEASQGVFDGKFSLDFLKTTHNNKLAQKIEMIVKGAALGFLPDAQQKLFISRISCAYTSGSDFHAFPLQGMEVLFNLIDKKTKFLKFKAKIYDGFLKGHAVFNPDNILFNPRFEFMIKDVSARELDSLVFSLSRMYQKLPTKLGGKIGGKFTGRASYKSLPSSQWTGAVAIEDGYLDNVQFFVWLADFFNIPELKRVDFKKISSEFMITDTITQLDKMYLKAEEVGLAGIFRLENNELVSSKLSLTIATRLLKTSPKFQLLLALVDKDIPELTFNFQLSGVYKALNFKWLESDFKRKLQKILPGFIERGIEKKVERAIKSIAQH